MEPLRLVERVVVEPRGGAYDLRLVLGRKTAHALRGDPHALVVRFAADGAKVAIDVLARGTCADEDVVQAIEAARGLSGVDDDPADFRAIAERHPTVKHLARRFAGARLVRTPTVFEAFAHAVVEQLVTYEEASASMRRLRWSLGGRVALDDGRALAVFPSAQTVAATATHTLRAFGIGIRRATTLISGATRGPGLERLRGVEPLEAIEKLRSLRGVGPWTAQKVAIEALGWADGVTERDAVLPYVVTRALTGRPGGDEAMLAALEPFRPHRARVLRLLELSWLYDKEIPGVPRRDKARTDPHRRTPWRA